MSILDEVRQTIKEKYLAGEDTSSLKLPKAKLWDLHIELYERGIGLVTKDADGTSHYAVMSPAGLTKLYPED